MVDVKTRAKEKNPKINNALGCFKVFGIVPNFSGHNAHHVLKTLREFVDLKDDYTRFIISDDVKSKLEKEFSDFGDVCNADAIITLGGDGTLIQTARRCAQHKIPVLGMNFGHLGFLTGADKHGAKEVIEKLKNNDFKIEERMMLQTQIIKKGKILNSILALNDVVISRKQVLNLIRVNVDVDNEEASKYFADGVIVSTPTGSTAYSLSAGGPIIDPTMKMILITPICPHSLNSRPIVIPYNKKVTLEPDLNYNKEVTVTIDGKDSIDMEPGMKVEIKKAKISTRLIKLNDDNFYKLLNKKLSKEI